MNEKEINQLIQKEYDAFNAAVYTGEPLPKDIIERFKTACFKLPTQIHKLPSDVMKKICEKRVSQLTNFEVPTVLNTVCLLPLCDLYPNLETAFIKHKEIEASKISFNLMVMEINKEMEIKRQNMITLSSKDKTPVKKIIAQA